MRLGWCAGWLMTVVATHVFAAVPQVAAAVDEFGSADSIRITTKMKGVSAHSSLQQKIIELAKGFQGTPYLGGTLETFPVERLVVRTDSVDCTTFVEYVVAMAIADDDRFAAASPYASFKKALQTLRYRDGKLDGYTSRLHYFSDWILDNQRKGIVCEVTEASPYARRRVDLNFMSHHASLYPFLANDAETVARMKAVESRWTGFQMPYIPKERLTENKEILNIQDGDILTLVTNISGLDVVHVGFALWKEDKLHLLHASSAKKQVLLDPLSLYQYTKTKRSQIGIRVIRVKEADTNSR